MTKTERLSSEGYFLLYKTPFRKEKGQDFVQILCPMKEQYNQDDELFSLYGSLAVALLKMRLYHKLYAQNLPHREAQSRQKKAACIPKLCQH